MKFPITLAIILFSANSQAIDFTSDKGREYKKLTKTSGLVVGKNTKDGFRVEAFVSTSGSNLGSVGLNLGVPLLRGKKYTIQLNGGASTNINPMDRYQIGFEIEYKIDDRKSFVISMSNKFNPWSRTLGTNPTIKTGLRFYF
jgi:hypothetical protein